MTTTTTTTTNATHIVTITPAAAGALGVGALSGFALNCSVCGPIGGSSLPVCASNDARAHEAYWRARTSKSSVQRRYIQSEAGR